MVVSPARRSADGRWRLVDEELNSSILAAKRDTCRMQRLDGMGSTGWRECAGAANEGALAKFRLVGGSKRHSGPAVKWLCLDVWRSER